MPTQHVKQFYRLKHPTKPMTLGIAMVLIPQEDKGNVVTHVERLYQPLEL